MMIIKIFFLFSGAIFGYRHLQAFLLFLFLTVAYMMRVNMSVAVVAMQNATAVNPDFDVSEKNNTLSVKFDFAKITSNW